MNIGTYELLLSLRSANTGILLLAEVDESIIQKMVQTTRLYLYRLVASWQKTSD